MNDDETPTSTEVRYLIRSLDKMDTRLSDIFNAITEIRDAQSEEKAKLAAGIERCNGHHEAIKELREANENPDRKGMVASVIAILAAIGAFIVAIGKGHGSPLILVSLLLCACGQTTTRNNDTHQVHEVTRESPTTDGGKLIDKTITYQGSGQAVETTTADPATQGILSAIAPLAGTAIGAATGTPGFPWGEAIGALGGAALTGYAALKHGQSSELKKQVEFHKTDADEGWKRSGT